MKSKLEKAVKEVSKGTLSFALEEWQAESEFRWDREELDIQSVKTLCEMLPSTLDRHPSINALNFDFYPIEKGGFRYLISCLSKMNITKLSIRDCNIELEEANFLASKLSFNRIKHLNLSSNRFTETSVGLLINKLCKHLTHLTASNINLGVLEELVVLNFEHLRMTELNLSFNDFHFSENELQFNLNHVLLEKLCLRKNGFGLKGKLSFNVSNSQIKELDLSNNSLSGALSGAFADQLINLKVQHLDLSYNELNFQDIEKLASRLAKMELISLNLKGNTLDAQSIELLFSYLPKTTIKKLILDNNSFSVRGSLTLTLKDTHIEQLSFTSNMIGCSGGELTFDLEDSVLSDLNLDFTGIGDKGSLLLFKLKNSQLTSLNLNNNDLSSLVIQNLLSCFAGSKLSILKCKNNKLDKETFMAFLRQLKNTNIRNLNTSHSLFKDERSLDIDTSHSILQELYLERYTYTEVPCDLTFNFDGSLINFFSLTCDQLNVNSLDNLGQALRASRYLTKLEILASSESAGTKEMEALGKGLIQSNVKDFSLSVYEIEPMALKSLIAHLRKVTKFTLNGGGINPDPDLVKQLVLNLPQTEIRTLNLKHWRLQSQCLEILFLGLRNTKIQTLEVNEWLDEKYNYKNLAKILAGSSVTQIIGFKHAEITNVLKQNAADHKEPASKKMHPPLFGSNHIFLKKEIEGTHINRSSIQHRPPFK